MQKWRYARNQGTHGSLGLLSSQMLCRGSTRQCRVQGHANNSEVMGLAPHMAGSCSDQEACASALLQGTEDVTQVIEVLQLALSTKRPISQATSQALEQAVPSHALCHLPRDTLASLLFAASGAGAEASPAWRAAALAAIAQHFATAAAATLADDNAAPRAVSQLLWAASELKGLSSNGSSFSSSNSNSNNCNSSNSSCTTQAAGSSSPSVDSAPLPPPSHLAALPHLAPSLPAATQPPPQGRTSMDQAWVNQAAQAVLKGIQEGGFFAPDLCTALCGLGCLGFTPSPDWAAAVAEEVEFQVRLALLPAYPGNTLLQCKAGPSPTLRQLC